MYGLSGSHLLILAVVLLFFGSRRLPEIGASFGKGLRAFKQAVDGKGLIEETKDPARLLTSSATEDSTRKKIDA